MTLDAMLGLPWSLREVSWALRCQWREGAERKGGCDGEKRVESRLRSWCRSSLAEADQARRVQAAATTAR